MQRKELRLFYGHPRMADGHLNKCMACTKKDVRENYLKRRDQYHEYDRRRYQEPERRASAQAAMRTLRKQQPGKAKARNRTASAVRSGRLIRQPCEVCGEKKVHAHHDDYRKPLDVRWLCHLHHWQEHGALQDA